jgi:hypothetical protein
MFYLLRLWFKVNQNPTSQVVDCYETKQPPSHQQSACEGMGRAHNQAIGTNDEMMASELQQSKWASMIYQVM